MSAWPEQSIPADFSADRIQDLAFTTLNRADFDVLMDWCDFEGWNPGRHDREAFWIQDPRGYRGFHWNGALIAGGSVVRYGTEFGFMGFFLVRPELRGLGIGRHLWTQRRDTLLSGLDAEAAIGMDGVVDMQPFYAKGGFEKAYANVRHQCVGTPSERHPSIEEGPGPMDALNRYDKTCFLYDRPLFLAAWVDQPGGQVFRFEEQGALRGWAAIRLASEGRRIGPLFADTPEAAAALLDACLAAAPGEPVFLDVPMNNADAVSLVTRRGAAPVFEVARMVHGPTPAWPADRIYGVTSYELG